MSKKAEPLQPIKVEIELPALTLEYLKLLKHESGAVDNDFLQEYPDEASYLRDAGCIAPSQSSIWFVTKLGSMLLKSIAQQEKSKLPTTIGKKTKVNSILGNAAFFSLEDYRMVMKMLQEQHLKGSGIIHHQAFVLEPAVANEKYGNVNYVYVIQFAQQVEIDQNKIKPV